MARDAFVGDTLFMPDYGSARCDFPGGDAAVLYRSIHKVLALATHTRLHLCHDYPQNGRAPAWISTVTEQRARNIHVFVNLALRDFMFSCSGPNRPNDAGLPERHRHRAETGHRPACSSALESHARHGL